MKSAFLLAATFLVACGGSDASVGSSTTPPSSSSGGTPPASPEETFDASGCPTKDVVHFARNGTELAGRLVIAPPASEAQLSVASMMVTTQVGPKDAYEEAFVFLRSLRTGTSPPNADSSLEYRRYPAMADNATSVVPDDTAQYTGATLTGSVTVTTQPARNAGDLVCGKFDLTGALANEPTVHVWGVFRHQYIGPQPGD